MRYLIAAAMVPTLARFTRRAALAAIPMLPVLAAATPIQGPPQKVIATVVRLPARKNFDGTSSVIKTTASRAVTLTFQDRRVVLSSGQTAAFAAAVWIH